MKRVSAFSLLLAFYFSSSVPYITLASCKGTCSSSLDSFPISSIVVNGNVTIQFFQGSDSRSNDNDKNPLSKLTENISSKIANATLNNQSESTLNNATESTLENTCNKVVKNCTCEPCKKTTVESPTIPVGYSAISAPMKDNNHFLTTIKFHKERKTWNDARITCYNEGGFLSYPTNAQETSVYTKMMKDNGEEYLWLGIHDLFQEGQYTTILGEEANSAADMVWEKNQPDNWKNNEKCVQLTTSGLNDISCVTPYVFICKVKIPRCL